MNEEYIATKSSGSRAKQYDVWILAISFPGYAIIGKILDQSYSLYIFLKGSNKDSYLHL